MFARNVSMHLKPNTLAEFTRTFEKEVVPVLRQQKGFKDEITFAIPGSTDVIAISLWDSKESADAYNTNTYPQVLKTLDRVIDGAPKVRTSEVVHSTFHKIATAIAA
jgi:heme-degrading monooxygenase HmoA